MFFGIYRAIASNDKGGTRTVNSAEGMKRRMDCVQKAGDVMADTGAPVINYYRLAAELHCPPP